MARDLNYEEKVMQKAIDMQRRLPSDIAHLLKMMVPPGKNPSAADHVEAHSKALLQYIAAEIVFTEDLATTLVNRLERVEKRLEAIARPRRQVFEIPARETGNNADTLKPPSGETRKDRSDGTV